jgi:hypothetical protein
MNMTKRESTLALIIVLSLGGWALLAWVIDPVLAAYDQVNAETEQLELDLVDARTLVDNEMKIRKRWAGYEKAGLSRSLESADAETGGALLAWAEDAGFKQINLSDGRARSDKEMPYSELQYTLQSEGSLEQICELLWSVRVAPFPLKMDKCVIDLRNGENNQLQLSLTVSTLFRSETEE